MKDVDIETLRKDKYLKNITLKQNWKKLELLSDSEVSTSNADNSSSDSYFDESKHDSKRKKKQQKRKKKKKASDRIRYLQKLPQSHLQFEYVNKHVKFDYLYFKLFIAGELEVISDPELTPSKRSGRVPLLKKIVYFIPHMNLKGWQYFKLHGFAR